MYLVYMLHDSDSDAPPNKAKSYKKAVKDVHEHFLSYDFELIDGRPFDVGNASYENDSDGYDVFSEVELYEGNVARFTHCNGEGPMGWIIKI
jgi:hypothetical protein